MSLIELFVTFLQAGGLTIGDGYACVAPLRRVVVVRNHWMTAEDFSRHIAVVQTMPGVFNVNLATYLGKQLCGWKGSAVCLLLCCYRRLSYFYCSLAFTMTSFKVHFGVHSYEALAQPL